MFSFDFDVYYCRSVFAPKIQFQTKRAQRGCILKGQIESNELQCTAIRQIEVEVVFFDSTCGFLFLLLFRFFFLVVAYFIGYVFVWLVLKK